MRRHPGESASPSRHPVGTARLRLRRSRHVRNAAAPLALVVAAGVAVAIGGGAGPATGTHAPAKPMALADDVLLGPGGLPVPSSGPRLPAGWTLEPAGTQVGTQAQPDGAVLSPNDNSLYIPSSGQWDDALGVLDTHTLAETSVSAASAFEGAAADGTGDIWAAGGGRNLVYHYLASGAGGAIPPPGSTALIPPLAAPAGITAEGYPGNMVLGPGHWLYVAGTLPISQSAIGAADPSAGSCPGGADVLGGGSGASPGYCSVVSAIDVSDPSNLTPAEHLVPVGQDAYAIALDSAAGVLYASNWADSATGRAGGTGTVSIVTLAPGGGGGSETQAVPVGDEPMGIALSPDRRTLAVANALSDTVSLISLGAGGLAQSVRSVPVGLGPGVVPGGAAGSEPVALAWSPDGSLLYVALFGLNALEVLHADGSPITEAARVRAPSDAEHAILLPETLIPTGWMPIALTVGPQPGGAPGTTRLYVANYQGMGAGPGLYNPGSDTVGGTAVQGSVSVVDLPAAGSAAMASDLATWSADAIGADDLLPLLDPSDVSAETNPCVPVPLPGGGAAQSSLVCAAAHDRIPRSAIHVVVVYRENKTVDSMLGWVHGELPALNASEDYETYGPLITVNLGRLAMAFGVDDGNWVAGDESETGHMTFTGGETTPATELFVHVDNDFGLRGSRGGDPLGGIDHPPTRLADEALAAGLSERTYGGDLNPASPARANDIPSGIWGEATSPIFTGTNTDFPDTNRAGIFLTGGTVDQGWDELHHPTPPPDFGHTVGLCGGPASTCTYGGASGGDYGHYSLAAWTAAYRSCRSGGGSDLTCQSAMPSLSIVELPDDHTDVFNDGNNPVMWAPQVMVANNDYATGEIVQGLSRSPFWRDTLVMIMEDDTQLTADHVNALRSYIVTAGGLARLLGPIGKVSHQVSSFCSADKTIEDLLGLTPMTLCDATASPLDSIVASSLPAGAVPGYKAVLPTVPIFLGFPPAGSVRMQPWCGTDAPSGIGFYGMIHYQVEECFASYVGAIASKIV